MDFGWADVREVSGIKKEDDIFVIEVLVKREAVDDVLSIDNCGFAEVGALRPTRTAMVLENLGLMMWAKVTTALSGSSENLRKNCHGSHFQRRIFVS